MNDNNTVTIEELCDTIELATKGLRILTQTIEAYTNTTPDDTAPYEAMVIVNNYHDNQPLVYYMAEYYPSDMPTVTIGENDTILLLDEDMKSFKHMQKLFKIMKNPAF